MTRKNSEKDGDGTIMKLACAWCGKAAEPVWGRLGVYAHLSDRDESYWRDLFARIHDEWGPERSHIARHIVDWIKARRHDERIEEAKEENDQVARIRRPAVVALLAIEWTGRDDRGDKVCPHCWAYAHTRKHQGKCLVDAGLTDEGLETQEQRDEARRGMLGSSKGT